MNSFRAVWVASYLRTMSVPSSSKAGPGSRTESFCGARRTKGLKPKDHVGRECCNAKSHHTQLSGKFRLGRSFLPGNEPGDARVHNRIEPDSFTDPFTNFLDRVIGKSREIKIFLDVAGVRSCGERSRDALYSPGQ
jgi:hypothetical protein